MPAVPRPTSQRAITTAPSKIMAKHSISIREGPILLLVAAAHTSPEVRTTAPSSTLRNQSSSNSKNSTTYLIVPWRNSIRIEQLAVNDLMTAVKVAPSSHYAVIWLHIARLRAGRSDPRELAKNAEKLDKAEWPWHVVSLFLGSSSPEVVRAAAEDAGSPETRRGQVCEADLYLGVYQQERKASDDARQMFESAKEACPRDFLEYFAANRELQRLR